MDVILSVHRGPATLTRTTHVCFPSGIVVMTGKESDIPSIHTCYYTYEPER